MAGRTLLLLQYWRSFDLLHAYAHAKDHAHLPAWRAFNRKVGGNGAVGYECVYGNLPHMGLARAGKVVPATGRMQNARDRLKPPPAPGA